MSIMDQENNTIEASDKLGLNGQVFTVDVKMHKRCGSAFAIQGGRIFQLSLYKNGELMAEYDRGWEIRPDGSDDETDIALAFFLAKYNRPRPGGHI